MQKKIKQQNIYAFIDSQNLNLGIRSMGWKLDFHKFRIYLKDKFKVQQAFLFIGYMPGNESLYTKLQQAGYIVVFKPTLEIKRGEEIIVNGNVDAELVLHTMIHLQDFDKAIIVSGDGDFRCLVEFLIEKEKFLHLIIPNPYKYSKLLREFRKYFYYLKGLEKKIEKKQKEKLGTNPFACLLIVIEDYTTLK